MKSDIDKFLFENANLEDSFISLRNKVKSAEIDVSEIDQLIEQYSKCFRK